MIDLQLNFSLQDLLTLSFISLDPHQQLICNSGIILQAITAYEAFQRGDVDAIDIEAVKAYMNLRGLNSQQLADLVGIGADDTDQLDLFLEEES